MVIRLGGGDGLIIDLGGVTIGDWIAILAQKDDKKMMAEMAKFNQKVLGDKYLDLPLVYMQYVNKRIMDAATRLFVEESNDDTNV